jgi:hypothetical protein
MWDWRKLMRRKTRRKERFDNRHGTLGVVCAIAIGGFLGIVTLTSVTVSAQTWTVLIVDDQHVVRGHTSIALDSTGTPHVVHNDIGNNNNLRLATKTGNTWSSEVVDTNIVGIWQFRYTSLALDSNDYAHISYYFDAIDDLKYARWDGSSWNIENLDTFSSLALDNNDYPHIGYYDETNDDLKYARWDGSAWNIEKVDWAASVGAYTSLRLDASDRPHISYYNNSAGDLMYAKWNGASWDVETVDFMGNVGKWTSLALDSNDYPHISYYDVDNGDLRYAKWNGASWEINAIASFFDQGLHTSIDVDSAGNTHIAYYDVTNEDLRYAFFSGSGWTMYSPDDVGDVGEWLSLVVDGANHPHISYYDNTKKDIKYATTAPLPPTAPQNLQGIPADGQVTLNWEQPSSDGGFPITNYRIYNGILPGTETLLVELGTVLSYVHTGLPNGQIQYYLVSALNSIGEGLLSERIYVTPASTPLAPQNLTAQPGDGYVNLSWDSPVYDGGSAITNYSVWRGLFSGGESPLVDLGVVLQFNDTSVTNGVKFYYKIKARNSQGNGSLSEEVSANPGTLPSAPMNLVADAGDTYVELTWTAPGSDGGSPITNYSIYKGETSGSEAFLVEIDNVLDFNDTDVINGQIYFYQVAARNPIGEGALSWEVSATPLGLPSEPQDVEPSAGMSYVDLTWSEPAANGGSQITNYIIYRGTSYGSVVFLIEIGSILSYNDTDVENSVTYTYRVSAKNAVGEGAWSDAVNATPLNQLPSCVISSPLIGETVSGYLSISGSASDIDGSVQRVEVKLDEGSWALATGTTSWAHIIDTRTMSNGLHVVSVRSFDGENYSQEMTIQVNVENEEAETPFYEETWFWMSIILLVVIVILASVLVFVRRRGKVSAPEKEIQEETETEADEETDPFDKTDV